ncbi:glycosyltransferase family 2 protein [Methanobrevibacter sp.]|uniref:glycosyltransferase family 2 protein n=1 Tax=Methanobrevibacter sp. TaxID=66852 RepID=UPI00386ADF0E
MSYKISVVIPVYNAEKTLEKAINSLLTQNWNGNFEEDIEIILVDDNSSDNSLNVIEEFSDKYSNIHYFSFDDNSGFGGRGRNKGISMSQGDYIVLMDNDDIYLQDALQLFYDTITQTGSEIVLANYQTDFLPERLYCPKEYNKNWTINPTKDQKVFDKVSTACSMAPWAKIYSKRFLQENNIKFREDSQFDDADFFMKCMVSSKQITILPNDYVYLYYTYEDSQVRIHDKEHFDTRIKTMRNIDEIVKSKGLTCEIFTKNNLMELFLMIANSKESKEDTFLMFEELREYQSDFDDIHYHRPELNFLNIFVMSKHYGIAYYISKFYAFLYGNSFIRQIYRSKNNAAKSFDKRYYGD